MWFDMFANMSIFAVCPSMTICNILSLAFGSGVASIAALQAHKVLLSHSGNLLPPMFLPDKPSTTSSDANKPLETLSFEHLQGTTKIYSRFDMVPEEDWQNITEHEQLFLQPNYLRALESSALPNLQFLFALHYVDDSPAAIALFSLIDVNIDDLGGEVSPSFVKNVLGLMGNTVQKQGKQNFVRLLMCGNQLLSDESCGFAHSEKITTADTLLWVDDCLNTIQKQKLDQQSQYYALQTIKDLSSKQQLDAKLLKEKGFFEQEGQPMMKLDVLPGWNNFDDYLASMTSKYRQRARSARKKGKALQRQEFTLQDIEEREQEINHLLFNVSDKSDFRLTSVHAKYFQALKREFDHDFRFVGYFWEEEFIGFAAAITGDTHLDAHLVGLNYEYNHKLKLYQNMLYDYIDMAISGGLEAVHFGRTALEIKSAVGAKPQKLTFYLRHTQSMFNHLLGPALKLLPETEWTPRNPFPNNAAG